MQKKCYNIKIPPVVQRIERHSSKVDVGGSIPSGRIERQRNTLEQANRLACVRNSKRAALRELSAEGDRRAPRAAGCEKVPSGNLLVADSLRADTLVNLADVYNLVSNFSVDPSSPLSFVVNTM